MITFIGGCASPQPNVDVVAQTLQTYQVGKTTFADFKKDAGLVIVERPTPKMPTSYLSPKPATPDELRPKTQKVYAVPVGSPWKIYEIGETATLDHGKFWHTSRFVIGDTQKPISILAFDDQGNLTGITQVP